MKIVRQVCEQCGNSVDPDREPHFLAAVVRVDPRSKADPNDAKSWYELAMFGGRRPQAANPEETFELCLSCEWPCSSPSSTPSCG